MDEKLKKLADECRLNRMFSKKTDGGYFGPRGEFIRVPTGIARIGRNYAEKSGGWKIHILKAGQPKIIIPVRDSQFSGDYMASLRKAIKQLSELKPDGVLLSKKGVKKTEASNKQVKLGMAGIRFNRITRNGKSYYSFSALCGDKKKTVCIPPDYTPAQFDEGLAKVKTLRSEFEHQHTQNRLFTGGSV